MAEDLFSLPFSLLLGLFDFLAAKDYVIDKEVFVFGQNQKIGDLTLFYRANRVKYSYLSRGVFGRAGQGVFERQRRKIHKIFERLIE